jgi:hypothetical protein
MASGEWGSSPLSGVGAGAPVSSVGADGGVSSLGAGVRVPSAVVGVIRCVQATSRPTARQSTAKLIINAKRVWVIKSIVHDLASIARALSHFDRLPDLTGSGV